MQSDERFPEGVIRTGCEHLRVALATVPLIGDFSWSGVDFRYWWIRFSIRCDGPLTWGVIRRLAFALNTSVLERWQRQPFVFKPDGDESTHDIDKEKIYWIIESTEPLLDPTEVADDLRMVLLSRINRDTDWLEY